MGAGHVPRGTILRSEIVQQPDGIEDRVAPGIRNHPHVAVQRLCRIRSWIGAAVIQAAQFEVAPQHRLSRRQQFRVADHPSEHLSFVHQIGQSLGVLLLAKLGPCIFPFDFQLPCHRRAQSLQPLRIQHSGQDENSVSLKPPNLFRRHTAIVLQPPRAGPIAIATIADEVYSPKPAANPPNDEAALPVSPSLGPPPERRLIAANG